jgi:hypothetical protein
MPILKREISVIVSGDQQEYCGDHEEDCSHYAADRCEFFSALLHRGVGKHHFRCHLCRQHFVADTK